MRPASLYSCPSASRAPRKEGLIDAQLAASLQALAAVERRELPNLDRRQRREAVLPGLRRIRHREAVLALGGVAHNALADVEKRTLIVGDLELDGDFPAISGDDIESFVWSCMNTTTVVALGRAAWRSIQLLPVDDRRYYLLPPLRMATGADLDAKSVLVIDHRPADKSGTALVEVLRAAGLVVAYADADVPESRRDAVWADQSATHVHVGDHTLDAEEPRLVDSWYSDRLTLQLEPDRSARQSADGNVLRIEDEVNGFICPSADAVVAICKELRQDMVLRRKLIMAGRSTVAALVATWAKIAEDMLA